MRLSLNPAHRGVMIGWVNHSATFLQDWNTFLLRFNELDFCVSENETIKHGWNESTTPENMGVTSVQTRSSTQVPLLLDDSGPINISVPITLTLDPQRPFGGYSRNITHLYATVLGQQVSLSGRFSCSSRVFCMFGFYFFFFLECPKNECLTSNIDLWFVTVGSDPDGSEPFYILSRQTADSTASQMLSQTRLNK